MSQSVESTNGTIDEMPQIANENYKSLVFRQAHIGALSHSHSRCDAGSHAANHTYFS